MPRKNLSRRSFLASAGAVAGTAALVQLARSAAPPTFGGIVIGGPGAPPAGRDPGSPVQPERPEPVRVPPAPGRKMGFAVVGLGKVAIDEVLPAFAKTERCKITALVTGHPSDKGRALADRYGIDRRNVFTYETYDQIRNNPDIDAVYIALPNGMHAEYAIRASRAGKHVLCEKPMATSSADCRNMINEARKAQRALMVAYRIQYEQRHNYVRDLLAKGDLGTARTMVTSNMQTQTPGTWRTVKKLSGGGALVDVGIHCLNTARFLIGHEPTYVQSSIYSTPNDDRFREVEEMVQFNLWFGTGAMVQAMASYGSAESRQWIITTDRARFVMDPAFSYGGLKLGIEQTVRAAPAGTGGGERGGRDDVKNLTDMELPEQNQFAAEMDHFAESIFDNKPMRTPGEEGLKDQLLIEAIYQAAQSGERMKLG